MLVNHYLMRIVINKFLSKKIGRVNKLVKKVIPYILISFIILGHSAMAAAPKSGDILQQQENLNQKNKLPQKIPKSLLEEKVIEKPKTSSDLKIFINKFNFEGQFNLVTKEELEALTKEYTNKELSFDEIQSVINIINNFFYKKGLLISRAILPKQEVKDGVILVIINEGKLDSKKPYKIKADNLRLREAYIEDYLNHALGKKVTQQTLERAILNLRDNPGLSVMASLEPGDEAGTSRVVIDVTEGEYFTSSSSIDNYGSRYTGENRATLLGSINNLSGFGDQLLVSATKSNESFKQKRVDYNFPIGASGLKGETFLSELDFRIGKELESTKTLGDAKNYGFNINYPIYRTVPRTFSISTGYEKKELYNEVNRAATSDKEIENLKLNFTLENIDSFYGGGYTQIKPGIVFGDLDLSKVSSSLSSDNTGARTNGSFTKSTLQIVRIQRLTDKITLNFNGNIQKSNKNLDSSEKLILGGPSGVRAYPSGEGSGDEGYKYNLDLKRSLGNYGLFQNMTGSIFYDYGEIDQYHDTTNLSVNQNNYSISGYGIGFESNIDERFSFKASYAKTLGGNPGEVSSKDSDGKADNSRFLFNISMKF